MKAVEFRCEACDQVLDLKSVDSGCYLLTCSTCGRIWVLTVVELGPEGDEHG